MDVTSGADPGGGRSFEAFRISRSEVAGPRVFGFQVIGPGGWASFHEVLQWLRGERDFRRHFADALAAVPHRAFRWEWPGLVAEALDRPFECVVIAAPELDRAPSSRDFTVPLSAAPAQVSVVSFLNLGADASLIVPRERAVRRAYGHLAAFAREAPAEQVGELLRVSAEVLVAQLGAAPRWLNTAGDGVPWLHIRVDSSPKYYRYRPYANE